MNWWRRLFGYPPVEVAKPSVDELREAREFQTENKRHVDAIERHVQSRIRADAQQADDRVGRR